MTRNTGDTARNRQTVLEIYAAFGRGDVPAILGRLSEDVAWEAWADNHAQHADVPWLRRQTGRAGAAAFFAFIRAWKANAFVVKTIMAGENSVAAEIEVDFEVAQNGARYKDEEMHLWTFDARGQVTRFRHYVDTAKHIAAAKGGK
jgi:ketosteroid isomerase-like protein